MPIDQAEIHQRFWPHGLDGVQLAAVDILRTHCEQLANAIVVRTPASREQSLALTNLETAAFWAAAAIARNPAQG